MQQDTCKILFINHSESLKIGIVKLDAFENAFGPMSKRELEKSAALYVVRETLGDAGIEIQNEKSGRPFLKGNVKISITHSYNMLAVAFSFNGEDVGVDVEKVREKVLAIKNKFLSPAELKQLDGHQANMYTLYWAIKESVYKAFGTEGLIFAEEIAVKPFACANEGLCQAQVNRAGREKKYTLHYRFLEEYILAYTDNAR